MDVAESRVQIDQCRLLVLKAAHAIDCNGTKAARKEVSVYHLHVVRQILAVNWRNRALFHESNETWYRNRPWYFFTLLSSSFFSSFHFPFLHFLLFFVYTCKYYLLPQSYVTPTWVWLKLLLYSVFLATTLTRI